MIKVLELTKENEPQYLDQIANLEEIVLASMKEEGREGQLFATGKEDISEYIHSEENTVIVATDENGKVEAATYVTQGQKAFTYNDITKYFKYGEDYKQYVKSQYVDENAYKKDLLEIYKIKLEAFEYAKSKILQENPKVRDIQQFLEKEIKENGFHEKSKLREDINKYMSEYIMRTCGKNTQSKYEQFYWITSKDIAKEFGKEIRETNKSVQEYESILQQGPLVIYEKANFDKSKYYTANTQNAVELDTYITLPSNRNAGVARIIVYEGIKKHIEKYFSNPQNQEIFLCSTLHRDNLSSKYVSEFFGLTDSLYVKRRQGRDREVHICKIQREQVMEYLTSISDRLAVLYGYNPMQKRISEVTKRKVLKEQLQYEEKEYNRLTRARATDKKFNGINLKFIESKLQKIQKLNIAMKQLDKEIGGDSYGE